MISTGRDMGLKCMFVSWATKKWQLAVLTGGRIKRENFTENVWGFPWDLRNWLYSVGGCIQWVAVKGFHCTVMDYFILKPSFSLHHINLQPLLSLYFAVLELQNS